MQHIDDEEMHGHRSKSEDLADLLSVFNSNIRRILAEHGIKLTQTPNKLSVINGLIYGGNNSVIRNKIYLYAWVELLRSDRMSRI